MASNTERIASLESGMSSIKNSVEKLASVIGDLAEMSSKPVPPSPVREMDREQGEAFVIPQSWYEIKDKHLGKEITMKPLPSADEALAVELIFPEHLDRRTGQEKNSGPFDRTVCSPLRNGSQKADFEYFCEQAAVRLKEKYPNFTPKH